MEENSEAGFARLITERLELRPLPAAAARVLPHRRDEAAHFLGATLPQEWPQPELLGVLPLQASASRSDEQFGVWVMIERKTNVVVGDIGFIGPPDDDRTIEVGYSVIPTRRRLGYANEALRAIVAWALEQPEVEIIVANCDTNNEPSLRTLERVGFRRIGEAEGRFSSRLRRAEPRTRHS